MGNRTRKFLVETKVFVFISPSLHCRAESHPRIWGPTRMTGESMTDESTTLINTDGNGSDR